MNPKLFSSLKNRFKLTKRYYSNPIEENKNLLITKSNKHSNMNVEVEERYNSKFSKR